MNICFMTISEYTTKAMNDATYRIDFFADGVYYCMEIIDEQEVAGTMNETLKTIAERYSCRDFADTPLTDEQVKAIAEAALAAPSARNAMPWQVIVVTDKALITDLDNEGVRILTTGDDKLGYGARLREEGGTLFYNAPCMVMLAKDASAYAVNDCGIVSQNVTLAAHSLGLGSVIVGLAGVPFGGPRGEEFEKLFKFPEGYSFGIAVLVGTPKSGKAPHELDMDKVTYIR